MPSGPNATASTSGASGTMVTTTSLASATALGDSARVAPAVTSWSTAVPSMSWTVTGNPPFRMLRAMGAPITPTPTNPTLIVGTSPGGDYESDLETVKRDARPRLSGPESRC